MPTIPERNAQKELIADFTEFCRQSYPSVIIGNSLSKNHQELGSPFEHFSIGRYMSRYSLDESEIQIGLVGQSDSGKDGGIDGLFLIYDGSVIQAEEEIEHRKSEVSHELKLILIQSKYNKGLTEEIINKLASGYWNIIHDEVDLNALGYSDDLICSAELVRKAIKRFKYYSFKLELVLTTSKIIQQNENNVMKQKLKKILHDVQKDFSDAAKCEIVVADAVKLDSFDSSPVIELDIKLNDLLDSNGYIGLCSLPDYYNIITSDGEFRDDLFAMNVRDFQNSTDINKEIKNTISNKNLDKRDSDDGGLVDDFWWLNNGITIVCEKITAKGNHLLGLENPQIVNGMQTSHSLYDAVESQKDLLKNDTRQILIRIIQANNVVRDKIIRATNSQNPINAIVLHATDPIQIMIEKNLKHSGWFYERRKNEYRNKGNVDRNKIRQVKELAQITYAMLGHPDIAWSRPSSLFVSEKKDHQNIYGQLFTKGVDLDLYSDILDIDQHVTKILRKEENSRRSWRFALDSLIVVESYGRVPKDIQVLQEALHELDKTHIDEVINRGIITIEHKLGEWRSNSEDSDSSTPNLLKNSTFIEGLLSVQ